MSDMVERVKAICEGDEPELTDIRSLARGHTEGALAILASIMHSPEAPPAARVAAANSLLDRGLGKAAQPMSCSKYALGVARAAIA